MTCWRQDNRCGANATTFLLALLVLRSFELSASLTVATNTTTVTPPTYTRTSCAPCDTCIAQAITTKDGSKYVGGWKDGRMDGEGELHGVDGTIYKVRS